MDHSAGLDVSVKETSVCIVDDTGKIVREVKVASEPEDLLEILNNPTYHFKRIGLEAGPLSQWLFSALAEAGLPVICVETRSRQAVTASGWRAGSRRAASRPTSSTHRASPYRASTGAPRPIVSTPSCSNGPFSAGCAASVITARWSRSPQ